MPFELLPVIDQMIALYQKPLSINRFKGYIDTLQGDTRGDLSLPIGGFNPMAKEHVLQELVRLRDLGAEDIVRETITQINETYPPLSEKTFQVAFVLSDDLKGGWTNRFSSDYDSKFKMQALVKRNFCTPVFWTSEKIDQDVLRQRTREYCYRVIYWINNGKPANLLEHVEQEKFIALRTYSSASVPLADFDELTVFYLDNKHTTQYNILLNFFYGDDAVSQLGYTPLGIKDEMAGFKFARQLTFR